MEKNFGSQAPAYKQCRTTSSNEISVDGKTTVPKSPAPTKRMPAVRKPPQFEVEPSLKEKPGRLLHISGRSREHSKAINDGLTAVGTVPFRPFPSRRGFLLGTSRTQWVLTSTTALVDQYIEACRPIRWAIVPSTGCFRL